MSTVSKKVADEIVAGKYPDDECFLIIRYENRFDGRFAYKCYFDYFRCGHIYRIAEEIIRIPGDGLSVYFTDENILSPEEIIFLKSHFPTVTIN